MNRVCLGHCQGWGRRGQASRRGGAQSGARRGGPLEGDKAARAVVGGVSTVLGTAIGSWRRPPPKRANWRRIPLPPLPAVPAGLCSRTPAGRRAPLRRLEACSGRGGSPGVLGISFTLVVSTVGRCRPRTWLPLLNCGPQLSKSSENVPLGPGDFFVTHARLKPRCPAGIPRYQHPRSS